MAEYKLGRLKFVWQGAWTGAFAYQIDDVVQSAGKSYVCVTAHTSTNTTAGFQTDLTSGYWQLMSDGTVWSGNWANGTYYQKGTQTKYGGLVYVANTSHTSATATATLTATGITVSAGVATITFPTQAVQPFLVGATITLAGFSPTQTSGTVNTVNTTFTVVSCTTSQLTFALTGTYVVSTLGTVAGTSQVGLEADQNKWDLFANSFNWITGGWTINTRFKANDIVSYGGYTYVCNAGHVSANTVALGLEQDQSKWDTFNAGLNYIAGGWQPSTRYKLNDIIKYGADLYQCTTYHTSTTTFDATKFTLFVGGFEFVNSWVGNLTLTAASASSGTATLTYATQSVSPFAVGQSILVSGVTPAGFNGVFTVVSSNTTTTTYALAGTLTGSAFGTVAGNYVVGDSVTYGGYNYIAIQNNSAQTPSTATTYWQAFTTGFSFQGAWSSATAYKVGNVVTVGGYNYLAIQDGTNQVPATATTYWSQLNSGIRWNNTSGSYTSVTGTNISGTGSGATFTVARNNSVYTVTTTGVGSGYVTNNQIRILGTSVGGITPANDIVITVTASAGAITGITYTGIAVTWTTGTAYVLGDTVLYGVNSYICVQGHTAISGNNPANDTTGTYWNLLTAGAESAQLTTQGDTFYYSSSGPARLPIGADGTVLRAKSGVPSWGYFGAVNQVLYVAPTGTDRTDFGLTPENPFKTIRYACSLVDQGYLNQNASALLTKNKQFMMKEVSAWTVFNYSFNVTATTVTTNVITVGTPGSGTTYQTTTANMSSNMPISFSVTAGGLTAGVTYYVIGSSITSTTFQVAATYGSTTPVTLSTTATANIGSLVYSTTKCERDAGLLVDAVIFDGSHGGTQQVTAAAQSYFTSAGAFITTAFGYEATQSLAAFNYLKNTLFVNVLANTAPSTIYQTSVGISAGSQAKQIIDTTLTIESTALATAQSNLNIVTAALQAGTNTGILAAVNPYTTISVKTGTYSEILPIIVPKNTAIVGDELRSTIVQPQTAIGNLVNDKPKSINALNRTKTLLSNIISNTVVTATTGNSQVITVTAASGTGTVVTLSYATLTTAPFAVGQYITVSGFTSGATGYNGSFVVTGCTTASVSFASSTTAALSGTPIVTSQVTALSAGDTGSSAAVTSIINNTFVMQQILSNGLAQSPAFSFTNPTGYNSTYLVGFGDGKAQIVQNYAFIKADVSYYLNVNQNALWTSLSASQQAACQRDVGYILDALQYDMTYGCNDQTQIVARSYYSYGALTIGSNEKAATIAAYTFLKAEISNIVTKTAITPQTGNTLTQTTTGTAGSAAAASFAQARIQDIIDYITNATANVTTATFTGSINATALTVSSVSGTIQIGQIVTGGTVAAGTYITAGSGTSWTVSVSQTATATGSTEVITPVASGAVALATAGLQTAYNALVAKTIEIQADTVSWVQKYYQSMNFNTATCSRDTGYIVSALAYDLVLGSNFNSVKAAMSYYRAIASAQVVINSQLMPEIGAIVFIGYKSKIIAASGSVIQATEMINDAVATITGSITTTLTTATTSTNVLTVSSTANMYVGQPVVFTGLPANITTTSTATSNSGSTITLSATVASLGIAAGQQVYFYGTTANGAFTVGGNYIVPYQIYYVQSASASVITISNTFGGAAITLGTTSVTMNVVVNNAGGLWTNNVYYVNTIPSGTTLTVTNSYASGTAYTITNTTGSMTATATVGIVPQVHGTNTYNNTLTTIQGAEILRANITFLAYEAAAYTNASYGGTVASVTTGNVINTSGNHNLTIGDPIQFTGTVGSSGIVVATEYYVLTVPSGTSFTITATQGSSTPVTLTNATLGSLTVNYYYTLAKCVRDTTSFINAIIYDLNYAGTYKTLFASQLYLNAVNGSTISNMFLVRNATGLRNMTFSGLSGTLAAANIYGTKRPTAGAYVSLDSGYGPQDTRVWVTNKSCYVQNVTTFGTGCVGAKVDGALHAGGNKSIVANDFTQVLSDGIGFWVTGSASLSELVSVFCYYNYAGYLAELGGKIRATNGNSSYGTYGVVAEGVDTYETPLFGTVNNRYFQAQVTNVVTDATNQILRLEYSNAGSSYTNSFVSLSGSGVNATATQDEFRDAANFETRIIDNLDGSATSVGGTTYVSQVNAGQNSTVGNYVIAATDTSLANSYNGMRVQTTAGTGVGQYANILTYNNGNKTATIIKDSFTTLAISAATNATATNTGAAIIATSTTAGTVLSPLGTTTGTFVPGMILTSAGTITAGTYITASNAATLTTTGIAATTGSTTGTVGTIAGAGTAVSPWTATITGMSSTATFVVGASITATAGTGTLYGGSPLSCVVTSIVSSTSITYAVVNGTTPTAGSVTNIQQQVLTASAASNLLAGMSLSGGAVSASYVAGQISSTGTALATATFTGTSGTNLITLTSFTVGSNATLAVGQFVAPISGIPANTFITAINLSNNVITVSQNLYGAVSGSTSTYAAGTGASTYALTPVTFPTITGTPTAGLSYSVSAVQTQASAAITGTQNTLTVASNITLYNGMPIYLNTAYANATAATLYYAIAVVPNSTVFTLGTTSTATSGVPIATTASATFTVTATAVTNNLITATQTLVAGQIVTFSAGFNGINAVQQYYVLPNNLSGSAFSVGLVANGTAVTITATGSTSATGTAYTALYAAGWDHVVPGTPVSNIPDITTYYIIEPRINYTGPGYTSTARSLNNTATWSAVAYGAGNYVAIANSSTTINYSTTGKTWTQGSAAQPSSQQWADVVYGGGQGATATAIVGGLGGSGAVLTAVLGSGVTNGQVISVTVVNGGIGYTTPPTITFTGGGGSNAAATCTVLNGAIQTVTVTVNGTSYTSAPAVAAATDRVTGITITSYGQNYYNSANVNVVFSGGGGSVQATATATINSTNGVGTIALSTYGSGYTSAPTITITDSVAKFVAISNASTNTSYSTVANLATTWTVGASGLPSSTFNSITYGGGVWVAVGGTGTTPAAASSADGTSFISRSITGSATFTSVAYGGGYFVAIAGYGSNVVSISQNGVAWSAGGNLPSSTTWTSVTYGNGRFVAISTTGAVAYSYNSGTTWYAVSSGLTTNVTWKKVSYGQGLFFAITTGSATAATSPDGLNWSAQVMPSSSAWSSITFGSVGGNPLWVAVSNTSGTTAASIHTGATALGRLKATGGSITETRMIEPGSGYPKGTVSATTVSTNLITVDNTENLVNNQPITFYGTSAGGIVVGTTYYVVYGSITTTQFQITATQGSLTAVTLSTATITGMTYRAAPNIVQIDPNKTKTASLQSRLGDGALGNPSFTNRGTVYTTASATQLGDGFADLYQPSSYINIAGLYSVPVAGSNIQFGTVYSGNPWTASTSVAVGATLIATTTSTVTIGGVTSTVYNYNVYNVTVAGITGSSAPSFTSGTGSDGTATLSYIGANPNSWYKLVATTNQLGIPGAYTVQFQINPSFTALTAPAHSTQVTTRLKYSQVRLTGHDFLYIGTGNAITTNYPNVITTSAIQANQTNSNGGGRVFYTSTDQDGNFNVGGYFGVQQATGTASLNATAFNLAGLNSLTLGAVNLGVGSATITQFSTDPYFTANSDNIVPTQKAIKSYITAQIGGGASTLNVNTLQAGVISISGNTITTTNSGQILVTSKMNFTGGIDGAPVSLAFFMTK